MSKLLSLCIPTYGVSEWVIPVLESIYKQNIDDDLYEVIITDNGNNENFFNEISFYLTNHKNIIYKKTNAFSFVNEIESYKEATGKFIKFVNHRTIMLPNSISILLNFIKNNMDLKPTIYYSNGELKIRDKVIELNSFDAFVRNLSYWSSWSTGMAFWKSDFEKIDLNAKFNELFPHTNILFSQKNKDKYIIDDNILFQELPTSVTKKGHYDLFYAFCVEYIAILLDLLRDGSISNETFRQVKKENLSFIANLYFDYVYRKHECSYDLSSFDESINIFYDYKTFKKQFDKIKINRLICKIKHI